MCEMAGKHVRAERCSDFVGGVQELDEKRNIVKEWKGPSFHLYRGLCCECGAWIYMKWENGRWKQWIEV